MTTVKETNEIFKEKGMDIALPYPLNWEVGDIKIVEKKEFANTVKVLLALRLIDEEGNDISDLYVGESKVKRERKVKKLSETALLGDLKSNLLPERDSIQFNSEEAAKLYLKEAFSHLLFDKGYKRGNVEGEEEDEGTSKKGYIYAYRDRKKGRIGFFALIALRADDELMNQVEDIIKMRKEYGASSDYGVVIPAFQDQFGISAADMDQWKSNNAEKLFQHHIGIYAVDNKNPNLIYPLITYPREIELRKYFMRMTKQWTLLRLRSKTREF
jgi:hypothetical protein